MREQVSFFSFFPSSFLYPFSGSALILTLFAPQIFYFFPASSRRGRTRAEGFSPVVSLLVSSSPFSLFLSFYRCLRGRRALFLRGRHKKGVEREQKSPRPFEHYTCLSLKARKSQAEDIMQYALYTSFLLPLTPRPPSPLYSHFSCLLSMN